MRISFKDMDMLLPSEERDLGGYKSLWLELVESRKLTWEFILLGGRAIAEWTRL